MQRGLWILLICLALFAGSLSQESSGDGDDDIDDNNEYDENEEDDDGEEEEEDENGSGGVRLDETPCQDEIDKLKASHQDDGYMPACTSDGHFKPRQCYESSCWCVNDEGLELKESRHNHDIDIDCNSLLTNDDLFLEPDGSVEEHASKSLEEKNYASAHPAVLAVIIGSIIASLVCAVLVVMFIVYRMKKKDEGSYILGGAERRNSRSVIYTKAPGKEQEFYA